MQSIMQAEKRCYLCKKQCGLERHHVLGGVANRRLSEQYGLWVWLCNDCHTGSNGAQYEYSRNRQLKADAQIAFECKYGHEKWMKTFGKNYVWEGEII